MHPSLQFFVLLRYLDNNNDRYKNTLLNIFQCYLNIDRYMIISEDTALFLLVENMKVLIVIL